jgi:hypothetical protein
MRIYQVIQNIDHLAGRYLVSAIVVAPDADTALRNLRRLLQVQAREEMEPILLDFNRTLAREIGTSTLRSLSALKGVGINKIGASRHGVLCVEIGGDSDA